MENFSRPSKFKQLSFKSILVCPWCEKDLNPIILHSITSESDLIPLGTANPHGSGGIFAALSIGRRFLWNPSQVWVIAWKSQRSVFQPRLFLYAPRPFFRSLWGAANFSHLKKITGPWLRPSKELRRTRPVWSDTGHCEEGHERAACYQYQRL